MINFNVQCFTVKRGVHLGWQVSVLPQKGIHFGMKSQCFITKKGSFWAKKSVFCCKKGIILKFENKDGYHFFSEWGSRSLILFPDQHFSWFPFPWLLRDKCHKSDEICNLTGDQFHTGEKICWLCKNKSHIYQFTIWVNLFTHMIVCVFMKADYFVAFQLSGLAHLSSSAGPRYDAG